MLRIVFYFCILCSQAFSATHYKEGQMVELQGTLRISIGKFVDGNTVTETKYLMLELDKKIDSFLTKESFEGEVKDTRFVQIAGFPDVRCNGKLLGEASPESEISKKIIGHKIKLFGRIRMHALASHFKKIVIEAPKIQFCF